MLGRVRLAFDVPRADAKEIDAIKERTGAATRSEVFRHAIRVYKWLLDKNADGYQIIVQKGDDGPQTRLQLFPLN
jgi:hypothetical protein